LSSASTRANPRINERSSPTQPPATTARLGSASAPLAVSAGGSACGADFRAQYESWRELLPDRGVECLAHHVRRLRRIRDQPRRRHQVDRMALAVGVLIEAFVIRMTLVPAAVTLLGDRAWSLPGWLDRLLPNLDIEGESLGEQRAPRRHNSSPNPARSTSTRQPDGQSELRPGRHRPLHIPGKSFSTSRDACVVAGARVNLRLVQVAVAHQRCRCRCDCRSCAGCMIWHVRSISRRWPLFD